MRILVTGANGYLGQGVVKQLLNDGHNVIACDVEVRDIDCRAERKRENLFEIEDPYNFFDKPDVLLHMAWRDGFVHNSINHVNDLHMHYNFIKSMVESGLKHVAILGSVHEVGFHEGSVNESTPTNPQSLYGISKNALRQMVELVVKENDVCFQWIRGFYIVGNTERGCSVFSKITQAERNGCKEFPFITGENQFDFLDYDDFCDRIVAIIEQKEISGIINCCNGRPEKIGTRVKRFIEENSYKIQLRYGAFPDRPYDSKAIWGDSKKIDQILNDRK